MEPKPKPAKARGKLCLGIEGSANKFGVGIVDEEGNVPIWPGWCCRVPADSSP